jgi:F-box protein 21
LSCLHRNIALVEWHKLRNGGQVSLERALGVFDLFIPESGINDLDDVRVLRKFGMRDIPGINDNQITLMLDNIVLQLQAEHPAIECLTPREKALVIASYLRENNLTGIDSSRDYHDLEHNFLGIALNDPSHNSLPLISAAIYCYVAQRFNLNARPCGFPFHVHVIITPEPGTDMEGNISLGDSESDPMYMDPFRSSSETAVSDLRRQLNLLGALNLGHGHSNFLGESLTSEVVLRCANNILNSNQLMSPNAMGAKYAALWSIILFASSRPTELQQYIPWLTELCAADFPFDVFLIERHALPLFRGLVEHERLLGETLRVMRAGDKNLRVKARIFGHKNIRYRVGQVFCHRRYNYRAIITGWDAECSAGEQWMSRMGIDRLRAGRHQSFYHAL